LGKPHDDDDDDDDNDDDNDDDLGVLLRLLIEYDIYTTASLATLRKPKHSKFNISATK